MFYRLAAIAFGLACAALVLLLVVNSSRGADFDKDWLLEDLTCAELKSGYQFNLSRLEDLVRYYNGCIDFYKGEDTPPHGDLHCALIKKEGIFLRDLTNDIVAVFNARPECTGAEQ